MIRRLAISLMLAVSALPAHAQSVSTPLPPLVLPELRNTSTLLPVVNRETGKFEAFLLVEPNAAPIGWSGAGTPHLPSLAVHSLLRPLGDSGNDAIAPTLRLDTSLRLEPGGNMALLCDGAANLLNSLGGLASHCLLGALDERPDPLARYIPALHANAALSQGPLRIDLGADLRRFSLNAAAPPVLYRGKQGNAAGLWWNQPLLNGYLSGLRFDEMDVTGQASLALGEQGWLSIGGSLARARLIASTNAFFGSNDWTRSTFSIGGGYGAFSGALIGHALQSASGGTWQGLDLGFSWQAPWNARLSIGAENILSSGDNRTGLGEVGLPEAPKGRTPYVRYQQDL